MRRHAGDVLLAEDDLPSASLYSPVSALKNVVLPAPLGPIRLTMPTGGMAKRPG